MASAQLSDLTGQDIGSRASTSVLFIPLGSIEQHGPHLPVDTDAYVANRFALAAAEQVDGLVAPGFNYGYRSQPLSGGGELFPGTVSLSGATYSSIVSDLIRGYARHGHDRIVLVNGHFENTMFAIEGVNVALERGANARVLEVNWWDITTDQALDEVFGGEFPGWEAEHAGIVETSLMMHLDSVRVRQELISPTLATVVPPPYTVLPERPGLVDPSGVLRTAHGSTAQIGRDIFEHALGRMVAIVKQEFESGVATS